jgi:hypothetical protein
MGAFAARRLAKLSTLSMLVLPGWYCWGFRNLPPQLQVAIIMVGARLGHYSMTVTERKWINVGLWACCWLLWPVWVRLFRVVYEPVLRRRTVLQFTRQYVILRRRRWLGSRRLDRLAAAVTFLVRPCANLPWLELKARQRGDGPAAVLHQQTRVLFVQHGLALVPIAHFISPDAAEQFSIVCQFANSYPLRLRPIGGVQDQTGLETGNVADI